MAQQTYSTKASRNLIRAEMQMLDHAEAPMVLGSFGVQKEQPLNKTDTIVFRRVKPFNSAANETAQITPGTFETTEGVTPDSYTIDYTDVSVTLKQYAVLFKLTSKAAMMYEDDIPGDMIKQTGEVIAEIAELVCYGEVKAGTTVDYSNGSTRAGVNTAISLGALRQAARTLESNYAKKVTTKILPGPDFGTEPVEPAYLVFHHTDCNSDIRDLPGFTKRVEYGSSIKPAHEREMGACEEFRFIPSPLFKPFLAQGSNTLNGMLSAGGANVDVYPMIVIAEDAWGQVSLKGHGKTSISPTYLPPSQKSHSNPSGMFGYVGADFWFNAVRLNENRMVRIETAVTAL
jgi:N4-gp56 family major capsid protein